MATTIPSAAVVPVTPWGQAATGLQWLSSLRQMGLDGSASIRTVCRALLVARADHPESGSSTAKPPAIP
jgi:hypothetical protein